MHNYKSPLERLCVKLCAMVKADALPLISGLVSGYLAHMFVFTNKLMNADEVSAIFSKGATIDSGRWALELLRYVFPDLSVPWLWGTITIVLITVAACIALRLFNIKHPFMRALLPALVISFPSLTGTFCFMFTSSAYAVAFLFAVAAAWVFVNVKKRSVAWLLSCLLLMFSVGIYQAYVAICASFFVIYMIQSLLEGREPGKVLMFGVRCVIMLAVSLVAYYAASFVAVQLSNGEFLVYALENENSMLFRVALAYNAFVKSIIAGNFGFVDTGLSLVSHLLALAVCLVLGVREFFKIGTLKSKMLFLLCVVLLPLAMNCIFLISSTQIIHSLVLYSFVSIYVLSAVLLDRIDVPKLCSLRDVVAVCMILMVVSNVFFANKVYLKLHLQYENAYSLYTGVMTRVTGLEGYTEDTKIAIMGNYAGLPENDLLDTGDLLGPSEDLMNVYTREEFIKNYLGYTCEFVKDDDYWSVYHSEKLKEMPVYPYDGSVDYIYDFIVVKLG